MSMQDCLSGLASRGYHPQCVFDIGAAEGSWTLLARRFWPSARYHLIEPLEEWRAALSRIPGVSYSITGVSDRVGAAVLGVSRSAPHISSFAYGAEEAREVRVTTLDALVERGDAPAPDFLKIDVQGYERKVLAGAHRVLSACDAVLLETQFFRFAPDMMLVHEATALMAGLGFCVYEIMDPLRRPLDGAMGQCDILFVRENHPLRSDSRW